MDSMGGVVSSGLQQNPLADFADRQVGNLERSDAIDSVARPLQAWLRESFRSPGARKAKDFLHGTWLGHPLHPAVTDIPVGAWTAASVLDLASLMTRRDFNREAGAVVAVGIAGAVASAVTGLADWTDTNPKQRRVGLIHAALNTVALGFQVASWMDRRRGGRSGPMLSLVGLGVASVSAYLGGELVYRQGTQVSRNAWRTRPTEFTPVMAEAELEPEQPSRAMADGNAVMVVKHQEKIYALDDVCGHAGCPLSQGSLQGGAIVCPCHGSTYSLESGEVLHGPSPYNQPCFDVRVREGQVEVRRRPGAS